MEILPKLTKQRVLPSASSPQAVWSSGEPGWVRASLARDPNGNPALVDGGQPLGIKLVPSLRSAADVAIERGSQEMLALCTRNGDVLVCDRLMEAEYRRAKGFYARARGLVDPRDRRDLLPAEVMAHVYEGVLEEVRHRGYRVLDRKTKLGPVRKLGLAARAWLYCHGFGACRPRPRRRFRRALLRDGPRQGRP